MYTLKYNDEYLHFLAMPRTASKSCRDLLIRLGAKKIGGHHDISQFDNVVRPGDMVVTTIRNHFDWFASFWELNSRPGKFDHFIKETCRRSNWIKRNPDCTKCKLFWQFAPLSNVVLRFEAVERDFIRALYDFGLPVHMIGQPPDFIQLPSSNESKPKHYRDYYTKSLVQLVENRFGEELERYGYSW